MSVPAPEVDIFTPVKLPVTRKVERVWLKALETKRNIWVMHILSYFILQMLSFLIVW